LSADSAPDATKPNGAQAGTRHEHPAPRTEQETLARRRRASGRSHIASQGCAKRSIGCMNAEIRCQVRSAHLPALGPSRSIGYRVRHDRDIVRYLPRYGVHRLSIRAVDGVSQRLRERIVRVREPPIPVWDLRRSSHQYINTRPASGMQPAHRGLEDVEGRHVGPARDEHWRFVPVVVDRVCDEVVHLARVDALLKRARKVCGDIEGLPSAWSASCVSEGCVEHLARREW
jgi:hypothetical protein